MTISQPPAATNHARLWETDQQDAGKRDKSSVDYGQGRPEGDHCALCKFWVAGLHDGACRCVKGDIGAMMWCRLYKVRK
jgi:hypothetical protein